MRVVSTEEMKKYYSDAIEFMKRVIESYDNVFENIIEEDLKYVKAGVFANVEKNHVTYEFSEKDLDTMKKIMLRSISKKVFLTTRADMLMIESFIERTGIKTDKEIFNKDTDHINPFALVELFQKSEKKFLNKVRNDLIKETIGKLESESKSVTAKLIADISGVSEIEAEKYLKRLESVNKAREKNSKVK